MNEKIMSFEEVVKYQTDKRINEYKEKAKAKGLILSELDETYFRMGVAFGIAIAGLGLGNFDGTVLVNKEN